MCSVAVSFQKMPHGRQRLAHGAHKAHVNIDAVRNAMGLPSDATVQSEGVNGLHNSSFNSSHPSDVSEKEDDDEEEGGDEMIENEEVDAEEERVNCVKDFLTLKLITKDTALFCMPDSSSIYLKGKLDVKVIRGSIEVLGHTIKPLPLWTSLYSPRGFSLLYLGAKAENSTQENISQQLVAGGVSFDEAKEVQGDCVFLVRRLDSDWSKFVHRQLLFILRQFQIENPI